jgi:23S rRNA pseudouridine1911/1915/1917 synthase
MTTMATDELPRLDVWLATERGITRHAAQTLIGAGLVTVNGRPGRAGHRVRPGDDVAVGEIESQDRESATGAVPSAAAPVAVSPPTIHVLHEDEWLAVIDKAAGVVVHPAPGHATGTLVDALKARGTTWSLLGGEERAGIVHRLDRDTSGLMVVAKTEAAHRALAEQLRTRTLGRTYWALVHGGFREDSGTIDAAVGRSPRDRKRMAVIEHGRAAVTDFRVEERLGDMTVLEVQLRTGRTHQIRVHMAYIRHAVAGDAVYGRDGPPGRPALHACALTFVHPADGMRRLFESPPPADLTAFLETLRTRGR